MEPPVSVPSVVTACLAATAAAEVAAFEAQGIPSYDVSGKKGAEKIDYSVIELLDNIIGGRGQGEGEKEQQGHGLHGFTSSDRVVLHAGQL